MKLLNKNKVIIFFIFCFILWANQRPASFVDLLWYLSDTLASGQVIQVEQQSIQLPSNWVLESEKERVITIYHLQEREELITIMFVVEGLKPSMADVLTENGTGRFLECVNMKGFEVDGKKIDALYGAKTRAFALLHTYNGQNVIDICTMFKTL